MTESVVHEAALALSGPGRPGGEKEPAKDWRAVQTALGDATPSSRFEGGRDDGFASPGSTSPALQSAHVLHQRLDLVVGQALDRLHPGFAALVLQAVLDGREGLLVGELGLDLGVGEVLDVSLWPILVSPLPSAPWHLAQLSSQLPWHRRQTGPRGPNRAHRLLQPAIFFMARSPPWLRVWGSGDLAETTGFHRAGLSDHSAAGDYHYFGVCSA